MNVAADVEVERVLSALVDLVSAWSSPAVQTKIARGVGLEINENDVRALHTLGRLGGETRPAGHAEELHLSRPTMSKALGRLAAAGLVTRSPSASDRRAADVSLTVAGYEAYRGLVAAGAALVRNARAQTSAVEADAVVRFTRALRASI